MGDGGPGRRFKGGVGAWPRSRPEGIESARGCIQAKANEQRAVIGTPGSDLWFRSFIVQSK